ncbi:ribonuclease R, partial [Rhizobiaceae sp. 2RAB30]
MRFVSENPDLAGKRDIAKAFGLKGGDRVWLKDMLRDLQDEGLLEKDRKRLIRPGALPHVVVLEIFGRDPDGGLLARAVERAGQDDDTNPVVAINLPRAGKGPVPGIGDRVLAKVFPTRETKGPAYT